MSRKKRSLSALALSFVLAAPRAEATPPDTYAPVTGLRLAGAIFETPQEKAVARASEPLELRAVLTLPPGESLLLFYGVDVDLDVPNGEKGLFAEDSGRWNAIAVRVTAAEGKPTEVPFTALIKARRGAEIDVEARVGGETILTERISQTFIVTPDGRVAPAFSTQIIAAEAQELHADPKKFAETLTADGEAPLPEARIGNTKSRPVEPAQRPGVRK